MSVSFYVMKEMKKMNRLEELLAVGELLVKMQDAGITVFNESALIVRAIIKELNIK